MHQAVLRTLHWCLSSPMAMKTRYVFLFITVSIIIIVPLIIVCKNEIRGCGQGEREMRLKRMPVECSDCRATIISCFHSVWLCRDAWKRPYMIFGRQRRGNEHNNHMLRFLSVCASCHCSQCKGERQGERGWGGA